MSDCGCSRRGGCLCENEYRRAKDFAKAFCHDINAFYGNRPTVVVHDGMSIDKITREAAKVLELARLRYEQTETST